MLEGRAKVVDGLVEPPRSQRGDPEGLLSRAEAGDAEAADHRQARMREEQLIRLGGEIGVLDQVRRLDDAVHRHQPAAGPRQAGEIAAAQHGQAAGRRARVTIQGRGDG